MSENLIIICSTFLLVLVAYWIMPIKKMQAVNKEMISLSQVLPITKIMKAIKKGWKRRKNSNKKS